MNAKWTSNLADLLREFDIVCENCVEILGNVWDIVDFVEAIHMTFDQKVTKIRGFVKGAFLTKVKMKRLKNVKMVLVSYTRCLSCFLM